MSARFIHAFETGRLQRAHISPKTEVQLWKTLTPERSDILTKMTAAGPTTIQGSRSG